MKRLGQRYVQYVNRSYQRSGTLWEGRYRSSVVQTEAYVLACYRYIEMNPVRAGMVAHPAAYPWSSYAANAQGDRLGWLTPHAQYLALAKDADRRRAAYRALFRSGWTPDWSSRFGRRRTATSCSATIASRNRSPQRSIDAYAQGVQAGRGRQRTARRIAPDKVNTGSVPHPPDGYPDSPC